MGQPAVYALPQSSLVPFNPTHVCIVHLYVHQEEHFILSYELNYVSGLTKGHSIQIGLRTLI